MNSVGTPWVVYRQLIGKTPIVMDEHVCPLCVEVLDTTDLASQLCDCSFKVCLYCYTRLCEEDGAGARCPSCRSLYDQERTRRQKLDPKQ